MYSRWQGRSNAVYVRKESKATMDENLMQSELDRLDRLAGKDALVRRRGCTQYEVRGRGNVGGTLGPGSTAALR